MSASSSLAIRRPSYRVRATDGFGDPTKAVVVLGLATIPEACTSFTKARLDQLVADLKEARDAAWPKPLRPLCPSSAALLSYLQRHDAITPLKAREELEIEHLPRRIKDLKEHGHAIQVVYERSERGKRYGRYSLVSKKVPQADPLASEARAVDIAHAHFCKSFDVVSG